MDKDRIELFNIRDYAPGTIIKVLGHKDSTPPETNSETGNIYLLIDPIKQEDGNTVYAINIKNGRYWTNEYYDPIVKILRYG